MVTRITSGIANQPLRRKLLAIDPPPDLQEVVRLCRSEESALRTESDLDTAGNVKRVSVRQPRPRSATRGRTVRGSKCMGCGGEAHTQGRQKQCNAWGKACSHCGIVGHFSNVCTKKQRGEPQARTSGSKAARSLRIRDVHLSVPDRRAPKVFINVSSSHVPVVSNCRLQFTPDTGAEVNAIGLRQLHLLGLSEGNLSACHDEVSAAGRTLLRSAGMFQATLSLGSTDVDTTMSVFHDIDDCLLSVRCTCSTYNP